MTWKAMYHLQGTCWLQNWKIYSCEANTDKTKTGFILEYVETVIKNQNFHEKKHIYINGIHKQNLNGQFLNLML